tara:strand:+ start:44 stop:1129 length:1086 start_codon:yes stop_codon:yes gene_type:complete
MGLQSSGAISLDDLHVEVGGTSGTTCSLNDPDIRALIDVGDSAGQSIQQYYGKSSETSLPTGGSTINGQVQLKQISASSYISSGGTLRIPSNMWVWSDSRTTAALTVDIPCTIINDGKIIGKGGQGGSGLRWANYSHPTSGAYNSGYSNPTVGSGGDGGPAINVTSSGVTISNSSGAYICGGGGGGGASSVEPANTFAGGGGGGGGADGGASRLNQTAGNQIGAGGAINAKGTTPYNNATNNATYGGQSGGPGYASAGEDQSSPAGAGGGRIVPGARVNSANYGSNVTVSYGGAGGETGGGSSGVGGYSGASGGGGGWGAAGGKGYRGVFVSNQCQGGSAGAAITGTSRTLSNSGTIYGGT